jgi:hypothetical protein
MSEITDVAEKLYKEINPTSKMSEPPSMVYEIIESHYKKWRQLTSKQIKETTFEDYARVVSNRKDYTKEKALLMISWGFKMRHKTFIPFEYLERVANSKIHFKDEDGSIINMKQFWRYREQPTWNTGWTIFRPKKK